MFVFLFFFFFFASAGKDSHVGSRAHDSVSSIPIGRGIPNHVEDFFID